MSETPQIAGKSFTDNHLHGMAACASGVLIIPLMDASAKWLAVNADVSPGQVTLARFVTQMMLMLPVAVAVVGVAALWPKRPLLNLVRGMMLGLASLMFFLSIKYMPLADAIAVFFVEPLILTALSVMFLEEKVGWRRVLAVLFGFAGALIVIQPSFALFGPVALLPLGTATLFAGYLVLNRAAGSGDNPLVMQVAAGMGGSLVILGAIAAGSTAGIENMRFSFDYPPAVWGLLLLMGAFGVVGHYLILLGFRLAPASLLAPFQYLEIVSATAAGLLLFGDFPNPSKWLGIAMIVGAGLFVFWRERRV